MEASNSEWLNTFDNIKNIHDAAYICVEKAITLEENEKPYEVCICMFIFHSVFWNECSYM